MLILVKVALWAIEAIVGLMTIYVVTLTVASFLPKKKQEPSRHPTKTFAIFIPAHNEELLLGRLLDSLRKLDYPSNRFDVYVVADNCSDRTSSIGRENGAIVFEREDKIQVGKGYALKWLLEKVRASGRKYDAFIIFDADSIASSNFLRAMNHRLLAGSSVIQSYYTVANPTESWNASLRYIALALVHYLRPLGKSLFGWSAGLKGNGMCFASEVLEKHGWNTFTLAEDVEFHLQLVSSGVVVDFAPEAIVWAEMPGSLHTAKSQNMRWERGRVDMARKYVPRLLWTGLRKRNMVQVDAALEQFIPPFSVPTGMSFICVACGALVGSWIITMFALLLLISQVMYVIGGLILVRAPKQVYLSLLRAPIYIAWKIWVYVTAILGLGDRRWVRTSRV